MAKTDRRILDLIKTHNASAYKTADLAAVRAMKQIFENSPKEDLENFCYWLLMNYYTYEIVKSFDDRNKQK